MKENSFAAGSDHLFPNQGSGDPQCPRCKGRGVITRQVEVAPGVMWPGATQDCTCVFERDLLANVKRIWPVLLTVESVESSPLWGRTKQSLWITGEQHELRRNLRYVAFRMGTKWDARVITDASLATAWLAPLKDVYDSDVILDRKKRRPSLDDVTLVDLVAPYDLLIVMLGVKAAKNREMPNLLAEALAERESRGKPTWVVDSPHKPFSDGHLCYSENVLEIFRGYGRVHLVSSALPEQTAPPKYPAPLPSAPYRVKAGVEAPTPRVSKPVAQRPVVEDRSTFGVDTLIEESEQLSTLIRIPPEELDLGDFPDPEELGTTQIPTFLQRGPLTREERLQNKKKGRR